MELHSGLVHFPIALLVVGAAFEVLARILKRGSLSASAHYVITSAAVTGLATTATGLFAAGQMQNEMLSLHKSFGLGVVGLAVVLSAWRISAKKAVTGVAATAYLLLLLAGAGFAVGTGWLGGQIAHGGHSHEEHLEAAPPVESLDVAPAGGQEDTNDADHGEGHHDAGYSSDREHHDHHDQ